TLNLSAGTSFNPKKEGLRVCSELGIHDHSNELSSSKLVPKVVPQAEKTATSRQELELLFHHHITMLRIHKDGDGDASFQLKFKNHEASRIKDKDFSRQTSDITRSSFKISRVYQGRLLARAFKMKQSYKHVWSQDTKIAVAKTSRRKDKDLLDLDGKRQSLKDNDKGSRSQITQSMKGTSLPRRTKTKRIISKSLMTIAISLILHGSVTIELTSGEIC
ncbi:hypothetical protein Tco_0017483, partial [Tanacetum coccineum]